MSGASLVRVINCPLCLKNKEIDFSDYTTEALDEDRGMGTEIIHEIETDVIEFYECGGNIIISGNISEYPLGAFNDEDKRAEKV